LAGTPSSLAHDRTIWLFKWHVCMPSLSICFSENWHKIHHAIESLFKWQ